ncbi:aldehyde dehydrogenase [Paenibacillus sp. 1P07SE]|uniref:aldehyde dehydrogenase n=1 Tax=Paenibacillus sp. 1P07SE TaxID=3132209 RepID=UPI0039A5D520
MLNMNKLYIGGRWVEPASADTIEVRSPHNQTLIGVAPQASPADVDRAVAAAKQAFVSGPWSKMMPEERQGIVSRFNELHAARADELAALVTSENGSPIWFTRSLQSALFEQTKAYLRAAADFCWEELLPSGEVVRREPAGVVAAVIPWNAPQQSALVKVIPALLAGCTVILKASPETALDALLLGDLFSEAGLPEGVLSILPAHRETSEYLISHPDVDKIAFTGSTAAGQTIASIAGKQLKRVSLELGGKSAVILLEDADLKAAVGALKYSSFANNAEACIAYTRVLAPRSRYEEVVAEMAKMVQEITVGDPSDPANFMGPMVRGDQQERVKAYIELGIQEGARLVVGGTEVPEGLEDGYHVRPTLFADVDNKMRIAQEEIFGPVIVVIPYDEEAEAIAIANDSPFGLAGGVWAGDPQHGLAVARQIRTGTLSVNGAQGGFDAPFGGFKSSGIGREFGSVGLGQYTEYKSITI